MAKKMQGVIEYKHNPFSEVLEITTKKKRIRIGSGKQLVDRQTGEMEDTAHIISFKQVDDAEFVKLFTGNVALTFDLSAAARKALDIVYHLTQKEGINRDELYIDDNTVIEFCETHKVKCSVSTFRRGVKELLANSILAKSVKTNIYYTNTHLFFNGDRYAFTQAIERKKPNDDSNEKQIEMEMTQGIEHSK